MLLDLRAGTPRLPFGPLVTPYGSWLSLDHQMIIDTILAGLADPSTLSDLLPPDAAPEE
ncbi:MAG: hypothetical protein ACKVII_18345 [Planctomycetales bacterium]